MKKLIFSFMFLISSLSLSENNFDNIVNILFKFEGKTLVKAEDGYSKYGLTKYYYNDIPNLTEEKAKEIIKEKIYEKHRINEIENVRIKHLLFDFIYHTNPSKAIRIVKSICKKVDNTIDDKNSKMTDKVIVVLNNCDELFYDILSARQEYIKSLSTYKKYGKGWNKRLDYFNKIYKNTEYMER